MEISISNPNFYFKLFYLLAFTFVFILVIVHSLKKVYHLRSVLLMLTTITFLTIIGSKLFTIPLTDWDVIFSSNPSRYTNRSAIGGLLFGLIGLHFSQKVFGFKRPILDLYAWIVPIGLGIQKIGCFLNGCCYGRQSDILWSVQYPKGTHAHVNHWSTGIIEEYAGYSANLHPVQLYETLFLFIIGYIVWRTKNLWKKNGSALLFGLFLFFSFRFVIEFIRDPASSQFNVTYLYGIRLFQWLILTMGIAFGLFFLLYEKLIKKDFVKGIQNSPYLHADKIYIVAISIVIYACNDFFTKFELIALWIQFIPAILLTLYHSFTDQRVRKYRLITSFIMLLPLYVISQSAKSNTVNAEKYKRIDLGGSFGSFYNQVKYNPSQGECGTSYSSEYYKHEYKVGGLGYSQIINKGNTTIRYGANLHAGTNKTTSLSSLEAQSNFMFGFNPYIKYDKKWVGLGAGLQAGNFKKFTDKTIDETTIDDAQKDYNFAPELYLRFGPRHILDIDYNYGFLFPSPYPTLYQRLSIGSGFGQKSDFTIRYGVFLPIESEFIYAEGVIKNKFGLSIMYIFEENNYYTQEQNTSSKIVFGLNYRFDHK